MTATHHRATTASSTRCPWTSWSSRPGQGGLPCNVQARKRKYRCMQHSYNTIACMALLCRHVCVSERTVSWCALAPKRRRWWCSPLAPCLAGAQLQRAPRWSHPQYRSPSTFSSHPTVHGEREAEVQQNVCAVAMTRHERMSTVSMTARTARPRKMRFTLPG